MGRRGVFYLFKLFLPAFAASSGGGGVSILTVNLQAGSTLATEFCSAEETRNSFFYSVEESAHSEAFRGLGKSLFRSSDQKGHGRKKLVLQKILLQQTELTACFRPRHASERNSELLSLPRNGLEPNFQVFACSSVPRNGIPSFFPSRNPSVCFLFFSMVQNSEHFSPLRNGSERNSENFLFCGIPPE